MTSQIRLKLVAYEGEGVARAAASTRVSLSESEDDSLTIMMEPIIDSAETPSWPSSAQAASLTNTPTTLTLAVVPAANATLDAVVQGKTKAPKMPSKHSPKKG